MELKYGKCMNFNDILTKLIYLTKRNNISNSEIGAAIGLDRQPMSGRAARNSKFRPAEIKQIESHFDVNLDSVSICANSLERQNDKTVQERYENFGARLTKIQDEHEYLDKDMAKILNMSEIDYIYMKCGDLDPNIETLNRLKQCFEISIDWLLYGD